MAIATGTDYAVAVQPSAGFVVETRDVARLEMSRHEIGRDGMTLWIGNVGQTLDHQATAVFDMACRGERFGALYATESHEVVLLEATRVDHVHVTMVRPCRAGVRRVAMTDDRWYVASDAEVHAIAKRKQRAWDLVAVDPIDFAASASELCVLDERGATWFDREGEVIARQLLPSPTAVMHDWLARGWLIAADGDVLQLAAPGSAGTVLARGVGLATRIRREPDALFAMVGGELLEVVGVRNGPTTNAPRAIASYAPGWCAFDACFELYVDEGMGPQRFYHPTPCRCRTRKIEVLDRWSQRTSDGGKDFFEQHRCPVCQHTWDQWFAG